MKVAVVSHSSADHAGAELALLELARGLTQRGDVDLHVVLPDAGPLGERLAALGVETSVAPLRWWVDGPTSPAARLRRLAAHLRAARQIVRVLAAFRPDVVVTNTLTVPAGALAARIRGVPHVWYVHEFGVRDHGFAFDLGYERSLRLLSRLSARVIANSESVRDELARVVPARKLRLARYAVEVGESAPRARAGGGPRIVLVGRKSTGKGQEDAVRALAELTRRGRRPSLRLVGGGDPAHVERLASLARELGVDDLVELIGPTQDVASHFAWADVALTCSRAEAFGRVTVEAMKLGTPVVGARSAGTAELVRDGWNGLLYEPGDAIGLADAVERLVSDPDFAARLADTARAWAGSAFSLEGYADAFAAVLGEVTDGARPARRRRGIAVVVPTYRPGQFLAETLASLERQTLSPDEVVVVDDGSEPPVELPSTSLSVRLLRTEHRGIAAARNAGVQATTAPLVHVCDHDDLLEPRFYERLVGALAVAPSLTVAYADCGFLDGSGARLPGALPGSAPQQLPPRGALDRLARWNALASVASVFPRSLFDALGGFRDYRFVQDWDFWIRAAAAGAHFTFVPELLAWHRVHPGQQSAEHRRPETIAESIRMLNGAPVPLRARWGRARSVAGLRLELARLERTRGRRRRAARQLLLATPVAPRSVLGLILHGARAEKWT